MFEFRTASFIIVGKKNGEPLEQVDAFLNEMIEDGWEFVQLSHASTASAMSLVLVLRRKK